MPTPSTLALAQAASATIPATEPVITWHDITGPHGPGDVGHTWHTARLVVHNCDASASVEFIRDFATVAECDAWLDATRKLATRFWVDYST